MKYSLRTAPTAETSPSIYFSNMRGYFGHEPFFRHTDALPLYSTERDNTERSNERTRSPQKLTVGPRWYIEFLTLSHQESGSLSVSMTFALGYASRISCRTPGFGAGT